MEKLNLVSTSIEELAKNTIRCKICGNLVLKNYNENNPGKIYWCPKHNELFEYETKESYIVGTYEEINNLGKEIVKRITKK